MTARNVLTKISFHLPDWLYELSPSHSNPSIVGTLIHVSSGARVRVATQDDRLVLTGEWARDGRNSLYPAPPYNRYLGGGESHVKITVDPTRPADQLARDIERRILSPFVELFTESCRMRDEIEASRSRRHRCVARLAEVIGATLRPDSNVPQFITSVHEHGNDNVRRVEVRAARDDTVDIDLSGVTEETARRILEIVSEDVNG